MSDKDREEFESIVRSMEAQIMNVGVHLEIDTTARQIYSRQIHKIATEDGHRI